jgi:hypothetical protein
MFISFWLFVALFFSQTFKLSLFEEPTPLQLIN